MGSEVVGDDDLFEQSARYQQKPAPYLDFSWVGAFGELRQKVLRSHDRTSDELGEERQVEGEIEEAGGWDVSSGNIDHVAERLEGEERDPDRQHQLAVVDGRVPAERMEQFVG